MRTETCLPDVSVVPGVLLGTLDQYAPDRPQAKWHLCDGKDSLSCMVPSPELLRSLLSQPLRSGRYQLVTWSSADNPSERSVPVLTGACLDDDFWDESLSLLPPHICPIDGVHAGTIHLVRQIATLPLRSLVERALRDREVCDRFWKMPASARHHHAFPGGLALHSLQVADDLAGQSCLEGHERDLCIAAGLLHDIGKVWSYTKDMFLDTAARAMGHELLGLCRLERELRVLEGEWPDGAYAMRVLLSGCGRMRTDGSMPSALLYRLRAADQRSCEAERANRDPFRAWRPKHWLSSSTPQNNPTPMD